MFRNVKFGRFVGVCALLVGLLALTPALASARGTRFHPRVVRFGARQLKTGMSGTDVETLQQDLSTLGWSTRATGIFNAWTRVHVRDFQRSERLTMDGVVGPQTFRKLRLAMINAENRDPGTSTDPTATTSSASLPADSSGGAGFVPANPTPDSAPVGKAIINSAGLAVAPAGAPQVIDDVIAAGNKIAFDPYIYGGGHASFNASGYDCSGSVSFALHGGGLLSEPLDSTQLESYGEKGPGKWITIWANGNHTFMEVAGVFFDTVNQQFTADDDRWSATENKWEKSQDYTVVHPAGW